MLVTWESVPGRYSKRFSFSLSCVDVLVASSPLDV